ncbi:uncharacterized protein LOC130054431 isoform X2 [Ostrea edulis]|uniref:uncharacterized protein LOC130054431 isoform X2 n=1 Tax=Ostrea edulis TaxID=37623 RepID=UPI0024AFEC5A|nr:uncharacterized protein LOC130054431 isoform X2 [Ostrea edulis]
MNRHIFILLTQAVLVVIVSGTLCNDRNIQTVGRVVFGEARGESIMEQLAVAYSIVNRVNHEGYPNSLDEVVNQKTNSGRYQYETLNLYNDKLGWNYAKKANSFEYKYAIEASLNALCSREVDITSCVTSFCDRDPCYATSHHYWSTITRSMRIGKHYFVCQRHSHPRPYNF